MSVLHNRFEKNVMTTSVDYVFNWAREGSIWPLTFGLAFAGSVVDIRYECRQEKNPSAKYGTLERDRASGHEEIAPRCLRFYRGNTMESRISKWGK